MKAQTTSRVATALALVLTLAGCSAEAHPPRYNPLSIVGTNFVAHTGEEFYWPLNLAGGVGGPYMADVISGALPGGVHVTQCEQVVIEGAPLRAGTYRFKIRITDLAIPLDPYEVTQEMVISVADGR